MNPHAPHFVSSLPPEGAVGLLGSGPSEAAMKVLA